MEGLPSSHHCILLPLWCSLYGGVFLLLRDGWAGPGVYTTTESEFVLRPQPLLSLCFCDHIVTTYLTFELSKKATVCSVQRSSMQSRKRSRGMFLCHEFIENNTKLTSLSLMLEHSCSHCLLSCTPYSSLLLSVTLWSPGLANTSIPVYWLHSGHFRFELLLLE